MEILNSYEERYRSQPVKDERSIARISANRAAILYMSGDYDKALEGYRIAADLYQKIQDRNLYFEMKVNSSVVLASLNRFDEALNEIESARKYYKENKKYVDLADVYFTVGLFYFFANNYQDALSSFSEAENLFLKSNLKIRYLTTQIMKGIVKSKLGDYKEALYLCENNILSFSLKYYCIALANDGLQKPYVAKKAFEKALSRIDRNINSTLASSGNESAQALSEKYAPVFTDYMLFMLKSSIKPR